MRLLVLAALALGIVAAHAASGESETGARDWRGDIDRRNKLAADRARKQAAKERRRAKPRTLPPSRRAGADCCDAPDDHWRTARAIYDPWRAPSPLTWAEAYQLCWQESVDAAAAGDYSKPASRRCVLGKMHAAKLAQWKHCRDGCRRAGLGGDPLWEAIGAPEIDRYIADDGTGATVWFAAGVADLVRVVPTGDGWRVDVQSGGRGRWASGATFGSESDADEHARELLDVPF